MYSILDLIKELYPLRSCTLNLSKANIQAKKFKVCLEYHIGNCKGSCEGLESLENYQKQVDAIREILKGNFKESQREFKILMNDFASKMQFEEAQKILKLKTIIPVIKANAYGHDAIEVMKFLYKKGVRIAAVSLLEEAIELRALFTDIDILMLGPILAKDLDVASSYDIAVTIYDQEIYETIRNYGKFKRKIRDRNTDVFRDSSTKSIQRCK